MYYATIYLIQATQWKIEPSGDCCVLYCCWFPRSPPTNRLLRLIRPLSIYPVGCCVCFLVMMAATIARDEWIYLLFFVELSIPLGWLLCFFQTLFTPACPRPHPDWLLCGLSCFSGLHCPCSSGRRWIVVPSHRTFTCGGPSLWLCQRLRHNNDANTAAGRRRIHRGNGVVFWGWNGGVWWRPPWFRGRWWVVVRGIHKRWGWEQSFVDPRKINWFAL